MTKQEILVTAYNKLVFAGLVKTKKEFAEALDYNYTCLSAAMNGEERYLTERFFKRIVRAYPRLNPEFLASGEGEVLLDAPAVETVTDDDIWDEGGIPESASKGAARVQTTGYMANVDMGRLVEELAAQRVITERAQAQTDKALAQIDQLIEIIKNVALVPKQ